MPDAAVTVRTLPLTAEIAYVIVGGLPDGPAVEVDMPLPSSMIAPVTVMAHTAMAPAGTVVHDVEHADEYVPAPHTEQVEAPTTLEDEPAGQTVQADAPGKENEPAAQEMHWLTPLVGRG